MTQIAIENYSHDIKLLPGEWDITYFDAIEEKLEKIRYVLQSSTPLKMFQKPLHTIVKVAHIRGY